MKALVVLGALLLAWFGWAAHEVEKRPGPSGGPPAGQVDVPPAVSIVQAVRAGCPEVAQDPEKLVTATAISLAESNGRDEALGDTTITDGTWGPSVGKFQIRSMHSQRGTGQPRDQDRLHDPVFNARSMCEVSSGGTNWRPWSVYLFGRYQQHLAEAETAVNDPNSGLPPSSTGAPPAAAGQPAPLVSSLPQSGAAAVFRVMGESGQRQWDRVGGVVGKDGPDGYLDKGYGLIDPAVEAVFDTMAPAGGSPVAAAAGTGGPFAFPLPKDSVSEATVAQPHHDYPASDMGVPEGTPVFAPEDGQVVGVDNGACGTGVSIRGVSGGTWGLCHFSQRTVSGGAVKAGQQVGLSGNTGNSSGPHLHVQWKDPTGQLRCPQPSLLAWKGGTVSRAPSAADGTDCSY